MTPAPDNPNLTSTPETRLVSFVLRFVCDQAPAAGAPAGGPAGEWHGLLRHVQSNTETHFTRWEDAVAFISQHVDLAPDRAP